MSKKKLTYQDAIDQINDILAKIENEELDVDELADNVKKVSTLIKFCKDKLHKTEEEVEKILDEMDNS